jgi:hypothetical protein
MIGPRAIRNGGRGSQHNDTRTLRSSYAGKKGPVTRSLARFFPFFYSTGAQGVSPDSGKERQKSLKNPRYTLQETLITAPQSHTLAHVGLFNPL